MRSFHHGRVTAVLFALFACLPAAAFALSISATPGTVVRWSSPGTTYCAMKGRIWRALHGTCYYPIDLLQKPGVVVVSRSGPRGRQYARVTVEAFDYGVEEIELPDIPQANPSPGDLRRAEREELIEARVWRRPEGPAGFTLPLGPPAKPLPEGKAFGVKRIYNGKPDPQPHMGIDFPVPVGSPVLSVADGTVVLVKNLFYAGNAVFMTTGTDWLACTSILRRFTFGKAKRCARAIPWERSAQRAAPQARICFLLCAGTARASTRVFSLRVRIESQKYPLEDSDM